MNETQFKEIAERGKRIDAIFSDLLSRWRYTPATPLEVVNGEISGIDGKCIHVDATRVHFPEAIEPMLGNLARMVDHRGLKVRRLIHGELRDPSLEAEHYSIVLEVN